MASVFSTAAPGTGGLMGGVLSAATESINPIIKKANEVYDVTEKYMHAYGHMFDASVKLYGAFKQRESTLSQAEAMKFNAQAARIHATQAANRYRLNAVRKMGRTRAAFGASGLAMSGSPIEVLAEQAGQLAEDEFLIRQGGQLKSRGYKMQESAYRSSAEGVFVGQTAEALGTLWSKVPDMAIGVSRVEHANKSKSLL